MPSRLAGLQVAAVETVLGGPLSRADMSPASARVIGLVPEGTAAAVGGDSEDQPAVRTDDKLREGALVTPWPGRPGQT